MVIVVSFDKDVLGIFFEPKDLNWLSKTFDMLKLVVIFLLLACFCLSASFSCKVFVGLVLIAVLGDVEDVFNCEDDPDVIVDEINFVGLAKVIIGVFGELIGAAA